MNSKIRISERFATIQGEGKFSGVPSFFIRTSGCNLRCQWGASKCDTAYTSWAPEGGWHDAQEVVDWALADKSPHVVITGGEPMLFNEQLRTVVLALRHAGKVVTIETNGTKFDEFVLPDLWSVSPKLFSSTPQDESKERTMHIENNVLDTGFVAFALQNRDGIQFKFVVCEREDIAEIEMLVATNCVMPHQVWLMPEGVTKEAVLERGAWLAEVCKKHGWNLALRNHVLLWGHRRGV